MKIKKTLFLLNFSWILPRPSLSLCVNQCNHHGRCNIYGLCDCNLGWTDHDCSSRTCPSGPRIADISSKTDTAHAIAECSGKGECDVRTGECVCEPNFSGLSCSYMNCHNSCSLHGECVSLSTAAEINDNYRFNYSTVYNSWDFSLFLGCKCDPGYSGYDCSERICPYGRDPRIPSLNPRILSPDPRIQVSPVYERNVLVCKCHGACSGRFKLRFQGLPIPAWLYSTSSTKDLELTLRKIPNYSNSYDIYVTPSYSISNTSNLDDIYPLCDDYNTTETFIYINRKSVERSSLSLYTSTIQGGYIAFQVSFIIS
jgi:hypothetical protein